MSREIKFRAWQQHASYHRQPGMYLVDDMVWHEVTDDQPNAGEVFLTSQIGTSRSSEFFEDVVIMQYTGLKDKNGVEIYEGDLFGGRTLCKEQEVFGEVYFDTDFAGFCVKYPNGGWSTVGEHLLESSNHREVIGNIYENPEMLEAQS